MAKHDRVVDDKGWLCGTCGQSNPDLLAECDGPTYLGTHELQIAIQALEESMALAEDTARSQVLDKLRKTGDGRDWRMICYSPKRRVG